MGKKRQCPRLVAWLSVSVTAMVCLAGHAVGIEADEVERVQGLLKQAERADDETGFWIEIIGKAQSAYEKAIAMVQLTEVGDGRAEPVLASLVRDDELMIFVSENGFDSPTDCLASLRARLLVARELARARTREERIQACRRIIDDPDGNVISTRKAINELLAIDDEDKVLPILCRLASFEEARQHILQRQKKALPYLREICRSGEVDNVAPAIRLLVRFRDEKSIPIFTALLFTDIRPDGEYNAELAEIRREAMRALIGFGKKAIGPVREVLEVRNPDATRAAVWVLRRIRAPEANAALRSLLRREERMDSEYVDKSLLEDIRSRPVRRPGPETLMKRLQELRATGHQRITITAGGELLRFER